MVTIGIVVSRNGHSWNGRVRNGHSRIGLSRIGTSTIYVCPLYMRCSMPILFTCVSVLSRLVVKGGCTCET
jgi:hypothetical protein